MTMQSRRQIRTRRSSAPESDKAQNLAGYNEVDQPIPMSDSQAADRESSVAEAAYFLAQQRGFAPGRELDDWLATEAELAGRSISRESPAPPAIRRS